MLYHLSSNTYTAIELVQVWVKAKKKSFITSF